MYIKRNHAYIKKQKQNQKTEKCIMHLKIRKIPVLVPRVWSLVGPVPADGVLPRLLNQSNISSCLCVQPHKFFSKLQVPMVEHGPLAILTSSMAMSPL